MKIPKGFKLSKSILKELPAAEHAGAPEWLWDKSDGLCAICDRPLPKDGKEIHVDHRVARKEGEGGPTKLSNLYLAHGTCNQMRGNRPFDLAKPIVKFKLWAQSKQEIDFEDVIAEYVSEGNQPAKYHVSGGTAVLEANGYKATSTIAVDPATKTEYFFAEIPVTHVQNDEETQPRLIMPSHVAQLAEDFFYRPVHEPSNCRLVKKKGETVDLLQFDGQHKTTAQILLGRTRVPMKIYVEPSLEMLQELVVQIQQKIKKVPLSTSDTLKKLSDVIQDKLSKYKVSPGAIRTEVGFVLAQPRDQQSNMRKQFFGELCNAVLHDPGNELRPYISTGKSKSKPLSDKVVVAKIIAPLMNPQLLDEDIDAADYGRNFEQATVLLILNELAANMLKGKWTEGADTLDKRRAENFFYQGSIGWWMNEILIPAIRNTLLIPQGQKGMFTSKLSKEKKNRLKALVQELCSWPVWSTSDPDALAAMRSNTIAHVRKALGKYQGKEYNEFTLSKKVIS
ncbi:MAG TPA: HNH endonuclease signature motif containing protein [Candidatus Nanoarchaeia archaeon]|nr:HNH endonuclease signature motif containing protein [Candidatus Nanoarchaeia archaeon]